MPVWPKSCQSGKVGVFVCEGQGVSICVWTEKSVAQFLLMTLFRAYCFSFFCLSLTSVHTGRLSLCFDLVHMDMLTHPHRPTPQWFTSPRAARAATQRCTMGNGDSSTEHVWSMGKHRYVLSYVRRHMHIHFHFHLSHCNSSFLSLSHLSPAFCLGFFLSSHQISLSLLPSRRCFPTRLPPTWLAFFRSDITASLHCHFFFLFLFYSSCSLWSLTPLSSCGSLPPSYIL